MRGLELGHICQVAFRCKNKKYMRFHGHWEPVWCIWEAVLVLGSSTEHREGQVCWEELVWLRVRRTKPSPSKHCCSGERSRRTCLLAFKQS